MDSIKQLFQGEWWQWVFSGIGPAIIGAIIAAIVAPVYWIMRKQGNSRRVSQRTSGGDSISLIVENNPGSIVGKGPQDPEKKKE